jgi:hypothetical protein
MAKQLLRHLDVAALSVALDNAEEHGPWKADKPDPLNDPTQCVYLRYVGAEQLEVFARRLPSVDVVFKTLANGPKGKVVRKVFT